MSKCLYNGVELPALPEWDKAKYPYAFIWFAKPPIDNTYYLYACPAAPSHAFVEEYSGNNMKFASDVLCLWWKMSAGSNEWTAQKDRYLYKTSYYTIPSWSNFDLFYEDGTLCFAASEPVPVGGEPEPEPSPTIPEGDFYAVVNGQWVKHTAVKSTGSEWVKQPQAGFVQIDGEWVLIEKKEDEPADRTVVIEWDGNTAGKTVVDNGDGAMHVKVSDLTPEPDELVGGAMILDVNGSTISQPLTADLIEDLRSEGIAITKVSTRMVVVAYEDNATITGEMVLPEKGLYFIKGNKNYVSSLTYTAKA